MRLGGTEDDDEDGNGEHAGSLYQYLAANHGDSDGAYSFRFRDGTLIERRRHEDVLDAPELDEDGRDLADLYDNATLDALTNWVAGLQDRAPRYEIYRSEIDSPLPSGDLLNLGSDDSDFGDKTESGRAINAPTYSSDPDRRVLVAAGIDCNANDLSGKTTDIPVEEFVRLFITEPMPGSNDPSIYTEVIGSASREGRGQSAGIVRDLVELVR